MFQHSITVICKLWNLLLYTCPYVNQVLNQTTSSLSPFKYKLGTPRPVWSIYHFKNKILAIAQANIYKLWQPFFPRVNNFYSGCKNVQAYRFFTINIQPHRDKYIFKASILGIRFKTNINTSEGPLQNFLSLESVRSIWTCSFLNPRFLCVLYNSFQKWHL